MDNNTKEYISDFLKDDNKNINAIGHYSKETPEIFYLKNLTSKKLVVSSLTISLDPKVNDARKYGNIIIKNGVKIYTSSNSITKQELPIKTNSDWIFYNCSYQEQVIGRSNKFLRFTFNFDNKGMYLGPNEKICVELSDDFTNVGERHTFFLDGYYL